MTLQEISSELEIIMVDLELVAPMISPEHRSVILEIHQLVRITKITNKFALDREQLIHPGFKEASLIQTIHAYKRFNSVGKRLENLMSEPFLGRNLIREAIHKANTIVENKFDVPEEEVKKETAPEQITQNNVKKPSLLKRLLGKIWPNKA